MSIRYRPTDISVVSAPITSSNIRNARNRPVIELGCCTPFQLFSECTLERIGTICVIGNPSRGIGITKALIKRNQKPFLIVGSASDRQSAFTALEPEWVIDSAKENLPAGNGAILFSKPYSSYLELCESFEEWSQNYFLILHLGGGLQIGPELLNLLSVGEQCMVFCESVPQSIRSSESQTISPKEFLSRMNYLLVFSAGVVTKDLIELLPTYQYEKVSNTMNINTYRGSSIFHPFHGHRGRGISIGQTRTMEYKKSLFEIDDLQKIFADGTLLLYNARTNSVFLTQLM